MAGRQPELRSGRHPQWYVAETLPRKEAFAIENLELQEFASLCPRFRKSSRHARKVRTVLAPLFPGYVFVQIDVDHDPWRAINSTFGVKRLLSSDGGRPQKVPTNFMQWLVGRCRDGVVEKMVEAPQVGDAVRIMTGPLHDRIGHVESLDDKGRVRVLLDILGGMVPVRVSASDLGPV
ncbi:transcription termination/antitermination protein NusG [Novosphingobium album (ex Liu et al. 2023)]|uniref:Transcriptional activator RfaH n=1 Tax=Novosphingobium album (ex Liu et al. 2023) TaxID=3031130 RepID=A0ABT5WSH5_9SPHN|nr:transcriptional activator RfaH [Novosphingobium album (ex Liu et al. 2023)]MDE8653000.1 transcriptional activator RfaH [Novosphingobium album (ex Liu et al. 2023)]